MIVYIGADHRGFDLKATLVAALKGDGHEVIDVGAAANDPADDYPDFARAVAEKVAAAQAGAMPTPVFGIVICGSGFGVDIVANKFKGVRSALAMSPEHIRVGRHDDDVNVLSLAADFITPEQALATARAFFATPFEDNEERYVRRLGKITEIENGK
ncbi:MAG TPA: RpiB/LacA/LacB family sugar-phosphate isomerase [Candidatus Paceibacterota bacterium]|nr:RpiB/LacA/LacB family sugar-phosphate isomerase [Candidatus Paceibacterota bacterium]